MTCFENALDCDVLERYKKLTLFFKDRIDVLGVHDVSTIFAFEASASEWRSAVVVFDDWLFKNLVNRIWLKI